MRTNAAPAETVAAIRSHLRQIDPDLLLSRTSTMDQQINSYMKRPRFNLILLVMFAATALLLAAIGLFGVMAYLVEQQTREIGIRTALGAQRKHILRLMVFRPFFMALVGVGLGVGAALALNRFLAGMLYGVGGSDPITYVGVSLLLLGVVAIACYLPARRATKVDPLVALRYE
jgi:putative ABC transport system permease protein